MSAIMKEQARMANNGPPPRPDYGPDKDSVAVITVQTPLHCVCMCVCTDVCVDRGAEGIALLAAVSEEPHYCMRSMCVCVCVCVWAVGPGGSFCAAFPLLSSGQSVKKTSMERPEPTV